MAKQYPKFRNWKERLNFYFEDIQTPMGIIFDLAVIALVLMVSAIFVIETFGVSPALRRILDAAETAIICIFVLEYLLRFWVARNKVRHFFGIYSLIDLLAIAPFFFGAQFEFLRVLRVLRFLRLLRFYQPHRIVGRFTARDAFLVSRLFFTFFTIVFVSSGLLYCFEYPANPQSFGNFFDAFYFSFITITTVGFGDIAPATAAGKTVTILMISAAFILIPQQLGQFIKRIIKT